MKARILIIDDEENIRFSLKRFLQADDYDVETAQDYIEAISKINYLEFDIIFTDIFLKDKSGIDILKEVREKFLNCPVIMFTGAPNVTNAAEAVRLGAFDYLAKPLRQDTLLKVTEAALRHKALVDEKEKYRKNLEAIFKSVKDAIITVDSELCVVEINDAASILCGIFRNQALGNKLNHLTQFCQGMCIEALEETIRTKKSAERNRIECQRRDRPEQVVSLTTFPFIIRPEVISGGILVIRDETRLNYLERNLKERHRLHNIIGKSQKIQEIYELIENLSNVSTTVLITGETGTGKELVAEALHYHGQRRNKLMIKANCSALSEDLLESELFGHIKGAFTGAIQDKTGLFERADHGTIFLDEIGDISHKMQLRLLRVLQDGEFNRVGDSKPIRVDVRVVAATNRDLKDAIKYGKFREDLYYRLKVVELNMPALRSHIEDLPLLTEHFLKEFNKKFNKNIKDISDEVKEIFMQYDWKGNVRELKHTMEHACIICREELIIVNHLPKELQEVYHLSKPDNEKKQLVAALEKTHWNRSEAAQILGMSRQTLYRKLKIYNLFNHK